MVVCLFVDRIPATRRPSKQSSKDAEEKQAPKKKRQKKESKQQTLFDKLNMSDDEENNDDDDGDDGEELRPLAMAKRNPKPSDVDAYGASTSQSMPRDSSVIVFPPQVVEAFIHSKAEEMCVLDASKFLLRGLSAWYTITIQ